MCGRRTMWQAPVKDHECYHLCSEKCLEEARPLLDMLLRRRARENR